MYERLPVEAVQGDAIKLARHAPAADAAAVVTIAAVANNRHVIRQIDCSYSGGAVVPVVATLTVAIAGATVWEVLLPKVLDVYSFYFPYGLYDADSLNQAIVVTLADPGQAGTTGTLNVFYE
jgi:hypothetical protein